jgi:hypothetical protein
LIATQLQVFDSEEGRSKKDISSSLPLSSKLTSFYRALGKAIDAITREVVKSTVNDFEDANPDHKLLHRLSSAVQWMHTGIFEMHA